MKVDTNKQTNADVDAEVIDDDNFIFEEEDEGKVDETDTDTSKDDESDSKDEKTSTDETDKKDDKPADKADDSKVDDKKADDAKSKMSAFIAREAADRAEIVKLFPQIGNLKSLRDIENPKRYGELRDLGLSVEEAFKATNAGKIQDFTESVAKQNAASKDHLKKIPGGNSGKTVITQRDLDTVKDKLDNKISDKDAFRLLKIAKSSFVN